MQTRPRSPSRLRPVAVAEVEHEADGGAFTDAGWTPMFSRIAAVVTEIGGVLSHAAVISREYGIPAVLAEPGATRAIEDGQAITVDGFAGTVELTEGGLT